MRHRFAPFGAEEERFLSAATGIDFSRVDFQHPRWLCVSCRDENGAIMGVCAFEFQLPWEAYFSIAIADRRCITRRVMHAMFSAAFSRAVRVTAEIRPDNPSAIRQAKLMGLEIEGYKRLAIEGRHDAILFGMTRDSCRYLRARPRGFAAKKGIHDGNDTQAA